MELNLLKNLQKIDKKIMDLEASIGDLPQQVEMLTTTLNDLESDLKDRKNELDECTKSKRKLESQIELQNENLKKYQEQVYAVTTNKEYDAISSEIENTEKAIEENETQVLELSYKEEEISQQLKDLENRVEQSKSVLEVTKKELDVKIAQTEHELKQLLNEREKVASQVTRPLLSNYERIRKGRRGRALAEVVNYTCSECFATIPAQTVLDIRRNKTIILCESCGRILTITNNVQEVENSTVI